MRFYCLYEDLYEGVQLRLDQIAAACKQLNVEFVSLNSKNADYSNLPQLGKTDFLYNASRGSETLETLLLNNEVTTFYINKPAFVVHNPDTTKLSIIHEKHQLPAPKTVFHLPTDRALLKQYVEYLGGFPLVLKSVGSTRGIGTIKIDSWQSLISTADYLATTPDRFIMRQYIAAKSGCRMIVLGNRVIAAADFAMNRDDFRNAVDLKQVQYYQRTYAPALQELAVRATHLCNVEFGGVDFLEDEQGNYYLLEVNFPTGFSGLIEVCGVDIPYRMVEYLKQKAGK